MKNKIFLAFIFILGILTIVGCSNSKDDKEMITDKSLVNVNGVTLHMNKDKEFKGIKYTITDDLKEVDFDKYIQYYLYQDSGTNLLFYRIFYYEGKNHNEIRYDLAIEDSLIEEKGKTENIEYTFIDSKKTDGTIHNYIIDKDNVSYVISFISKYDIKDFENIVLNSIKF